MNIFPGNRTTQFASLTFLVLPAILAGLTARAPVAIDLHASQHSAPNPLTSIQNLQLAFERNKGQSAREVQFISRALHYTVFLEAHKATIVFPGAGLHSVPKQALVTKGVADSEFVSLRLLQSNRTAVPLTEEPLLSEANYFLGSDPGQWRTHVPLFGRVHYRSVYKNVDLVYYGNETQLEYDFVVRPGGDPQSIGFSLEGAHRAEIERSGNLTMRVGEAQFALRRPIAYQIIHSQKHTVPARFLPLGGGQFGIQVGSYDRRFPLIVDPVLAYSTYLGGSDDEGIFGIGFDNEGNLYVAGETSSLDFPNKGAIQNDVGGNYDAFVSKFDPTGTRLIYSTYLGGSLFDHAVGIQIDELGSAYIAGITLSTDFPVKNASQPFPGGGYDGFVSKLSPSGSELVFSTYLGGRGFDEVAALAIDHDNHVYVAGATNSLDLPITSNAFEKDCDGGAHTGFCIGDAFVTEFDASGQSLVYSTYLGGTGFDGASGLAVDEQGQAYVAGQTSSSNFPRTNAYQSSLSGPSDAFVTKLNATGSDVVFSTFLGGSGFDGATGVALDHRDRVYVTGTTNSMDFPLIRPFQSKNRGGFTDGFIAKLDSQTSELVYSTYLGGTGFDVPLRIAVNGRDEPSVVGFTSSTDFPTYNALNSFYGGGAADAFVAMLDRSGQKLRFATYLGGTGDDYGYGITIGRGNTVWVGGSTSSKDFPILDAFQPAYSGGPFDGFLMKIVDIDEDEQ